MHSGEPVNISKIIRSQKTGMLLPRAGTFVCEIENLGRQMILVDFGALGQEYVFPEEIEQE